MESHISPNSQEPPMFLQRPSSGRSQDVGHILAKTFRELFTRDSIRPETIQNLSVSRGGDDPYHDRYVETLQKVNDERERRMAEITMLERHIMQAQARAMSADERELNRVSSGHRNYRELGLPPARSHFRACINSDMLRKHKLLTPEDFATEEPPAVPPPLPPKIPQYAKDTQNSTFLRRSYDELMSSPGPTLRNSEDTLHFSKDNDLDDLDPDTLPRTMEKWFQNRNDQWKEQLDPTQREVNRKDLENLQARANYLKNPRHVPPSAPGGGRTLIKPHKKKPKQIGIKPQPEEQPVKKEPSVVFVASPPVVQFHEYQVGQVYEATLELKNVTTALRQCRVIPPKTSYFAVGLGMFPGESGVVAPGMSCQYTIRFIPDCLGDFNDEISVQTQSSTPMVISIRAKRQPPVLTLPQAIDVDQCLVGGVKTTHIKIHNKGGPGKFCMMARSHWPTTNFKSVAKVGTVTDIAPFEIRPSVFELGRDQSIILEVLFAPPSVRKYMQTVTMVCDNCQVQHFTLEGEGQTAGVEISEVDGGISESLPGEMCDVAAQQLIRFPNLNPFTYMQKRMILRNTTNVALPFNWKVIKPCLMAPDPERPNDTDVPTDRILDIDSSFSIDPQNGVLPPRGTADFSLTFAPPEITTYHSVLHLILQEIPDAKTDERPSSSKSNASDVSEIAMPSEVPSLRDVTAMEIELKGECEAFKLLLQPYAINIQEKILVGTSVRKQFQMFNNSISSVVFQWDRANTDFILQVEPPMGELAAGEGLLLDVDLTSDIPGHINHTLLCHVENLDDAIPLNVQAIIKGPDVIIDEPDVNFGLIRLGKTASKEIKIQNTSQVSAKWWLQESPEYQSTDATFEFSPVNGVLKPLESKKVTVTFNPKKCQSMRSIIDMYVQDGNESHIAARAEVQVPDVCLMSSQLTMAEVYVDVPVTRIVTLYNKTLLDTDFRWGELDGDQADICSVTATPSAGHLESREKCDVTLTFTSHRQGKIDDLRLPCYIDGMSHALCLGMSTDVKGLKVTYRTPLPAEFDTRVDDEELLLDFGQKVGLGEDVRRYIYIKNLSAIAAPYSIHVENFSARPPTPPTSEKGYMPNKSQRKSSILNKTPNLANPMSKTAAKAHADTCAVLLKEGKGAAFVVQSASGVLQPFAEQEIEVTAYSDMWGTYVDRLVCKVEKLDLVYIPIKMTIVGCPLKFQMAATHAGTQPMVRFGTHVSGVDPINRQMRINNPTPYDIRVDWQIYNVVPDDRQLLDVVVSLGDAFPLKDKKGVDIVPQIEEPPRPARLPTDLILDSPDSSLPSRQLTSLTRDHTKVRAQFASVFIRQHEGVMCTEPFDITPKQLVIPAHGTSQISVCLTPYADSENGRECSSYALGYLSLDKKKHAKTTENVGRICGYEMEPIKLEMAAFIKPALLSIECNDDEDMRYRSALSDIMIDGQMNDSSIKTSSATLSNMTETPLTFKLITYQPFIMCDLDPVVKKFTQETNFNTLNPQHNFEVKVGFCTSLDLLTYKERLSLGQEVDGVHMDVRTNGERKLHFYSNLVAEFNNGTKQTLPLHATLAIPQMELSKDTLDFGTCLVGQEREQEFLISNLTASGSFWTCMLESSSDTCSEETFRITPTSGSLEAHVTYITRSKTLVKVFFKAKHAELYEGVYLFQGTLGEEPRRLKVIGQGSYDEKHEALVNV